MLAIRFHMHHYTTTGRALLHQLQSIYQPGLPYPSSVVPQLVPRKMNIHMFFACWPRRIPLNVCDFTLSTKKKALLHYASFSNKTAASIEASSN